MKAMVAKADAKNGSEQSLPRVYDILGPQRQFVNICVLIRSFGIESWARGVVCPWKVHKQYCLEACSPKPGFHSLDKWPKRWPSCRSLDNTETICTSCDNDIRRGNVTADDDKLAVQMLARNRNSPGPAS